MASLGAISKLIIFFFTILNNIINDSQFFNYICNYINIYDNVYLNKIEENSSNSVKNILKFRKLNNRPSLLNSKKIENVKNKDSEDNIKQNSINDVISKSNTNLNQIDKKILN